MKKPSIIKNNLISGDKDNFKGVQDKEKSVKRTETYLGDVDHHAKRTQKIVKNPLIVDKENSDQQLLNDKQNIKSYISSKRMLSKKLTDENKLLEREKKIIIEKRLKLLAQKVKVLDKQQKNNAKNDKSIIENMPNEHKQKEIKLESTKKNTENLHKRSADDLSIDSETLSKSIKLKLAQWEPMEVDELEMHKLASQNYMRNAINTNRHADNILSDIITIADKIQLTKQELFKFADGRISGYPLHCNQSNRKVSSEASSFSKSSSIESSNKTDEDSYLFDLKPFAEERPQKDNIKKAVKPSILAYRARRKLDIDINDQDICKNDENESTSSDHNNRIARLIEENKIRYEQSVEKRQPIMLPKTSVRKPQINEVKRSSKHRDIMSANDTDSLTFMRTYRRCKYSSNFEYQRRSKTSVEVSLTSHDPTSSNRNSHSSIREIYSSRSGKISNIQEELADDRQFTNHSERSKPASTSIRDTIASHQSSHDYSEMDVFVENSESFKYFNQELKHHKIPPKKINCQSSELRMSPNSLERQLLVEMHYHDSLQASMEQLLQAERFQGVGFAQQETVSLAQILKARQWKDAREVETNENLQRFTSALENLNKMSSYHQHKRISSTSSDESSAIITDNTSKVSSRRGRSTTESEASEIEEDIVDVYYSNESQHHSSQSSNYRTDRQIIVKPVKLKHQGLPAVADKQKETKKTKYPVVELDLGHLNNDESIQEVSTALSISKGSNLDNVKQSSKDSSIVESIDTPSITVKSTSNDQSKDSEIRDSNTDQSVTKSIKTDSNFIKSQNTTKEISTAKSFESEKKSQTSKSDSKSKSGSKSTTSISTNSDHHASKSDLSATNYSEDKFDTNSEYQKSTSESELVNRVDILEREKEKKQKLVDKLKHKLSIVKHRHKEKTLQNYINHLDSQIDTLKDELKNPNLSLSSMSLSPVTKPKKTKKAKEILPTFNRMSSSSSSTVSKDDVKSISVTGSISSSTLVSDQIKDKPSNGYNQIDNKKIEDVDTPRSSKQIQFEDINEEYSASNQDSSDLQTPSEKSRFSKEITDNGATKSKSENFHILVIEKQKDEDDQDSVNRENEDLKVISARTIHSEISEIPMEGELSDQEIDDFFDKNDESEKQKSNSYGDLYSEDFSDVKSQKHSKFPNTNYPELNEISSHDEKISYEPSPSESSHSSDSMPPAIPVRRKFITQSADEISAASTSENLNEQVLTVTNICSHLFKTILDEIMSEELVDKPVSKPVDLLLEYSDIKMVHPGQSISPAEDSLLNASIDSLNDQPTDSKFEPMRTLISWNDETIIPLVDIAIEHLFYARQMRQGKTSKAFSNCLANVPDSFKKINSDAEVTHIYSQWVVHQARDKDKIDVHNLFISRSAIYAVVVEIMNDIYELDDLPDPSPWMDYASNAMLKKKLVLWQGQNTPNSLDRVTQIVRKQLSILHILSNPRVVPFRRSRQHQWFAKQALDYVDKLLIDETFQDDINWQNYDNALEKTIYMITDDFLSNEISDIINQVEIINDLIRQHPG